MRSCPRPIALALTFQLLIPAPVLAGVSGEHVVRGEASIDRNGDTTTIHASDGAIINYDQFSVWANEQLHFIQPSSDARVLNRVSGDATHIDGGLFANGIVYIVNPAGVFFGGGAVVDVGGLYAAAGNISDADFLARRDAFTLSGTVENAGSIESPVVALVGTAVANHGNIKAPDGTIALVAGEKVVLTQLGAHLAVQVEGAAGGGDAAAAIEQAGSVDAGAGSISFTTGDVYSLAINHTGITRGAQIDLSAASGTVQVAGTLDASDRSAGATGGAISVTGERVALLGAQLDASGDAGGGSIRVGGDLRGAGPLANAKRTFVDEASGLRADAIRSGNGGQVIVWADEATAFLGSISARGGAEGGDGGFAEVSGAVFLWSKGDVDLRAVKGATGTLLYDPKEIELVGGTGEGNDSGSLPGEIDNGTAGRVLFADASSLGTKFRIFESEIEGTDANVVLEATHSITSTGTFDNDASGEGVGVVRIIDGNSLTMRTRNNTGDDASSTTSAGIHLTGLSFQTGNDGTDVGSITIATGNDGAGGGGTGPDAGIEVANLTTAGGAVTVTTEGGPIAVGNVTTSGADDTAGGAAGAVTLTAGSSASITAGVIEAQGGVGSSDVGGAGGAIALRTTDGDISITSATASGGAGSVPGGVGGGAGGAISLRAGDADASGDSDVTVTGDLVSRGGAASAGSGGAGGSVIVRSDGVARTVVPNPPPTPSATPTIGGGAIEVTDVDTRGGAGADRGGAGGFIQLQTTDGTITADDLDTSGGAGGSSGGNAGSIGVLTRDADMQNDNDVELGDLRATGGDGTTKSGGNGGTISVQTERSLLVTEQGEPDNVLQEAIGGGDVTIATIDSTGGDGGTSGGAGGGVTVQARGAGNSLDLGPITARGGDGGGSAPAQGENNNGGRGGAVTLLAQDSDLVVDAAIDTRGGNAGTNSGNNALGGSGGAVRLTTGIEEEDSGDVVVEVPIDAREGTSGASATETVKATVDGGLVAIVSAGDIDQVGAGPAIRTSGDVSLSAKNDIGQDTGGFLVRGGDERRTGTNGAILDEDDLSVTAGGTADVDVEAGGRFRGTLSATATSLSADIEVEQPGSGAGDRIELVGDGTQVTLLRADGTDNGISLTVALQNPDPDSSADGTLVLATGSVTAGRVFDAHSDGDVIIGTTNGTVITASAVQNPVTDADLDAVLLSADNDEDGTGALLDTANGTGRIDLDESDPGHLVLFAAEGIGTASDPITTTGGGGLSALVIPRKPDTDPDTENGVVPDPDAAAGIYVHNLAGDLTIKPSDTFTGLEGVRVATGAGDVEITNDLGDIAIEGELRSRPLVESLGTGGDLTLRALDPGSRITIDTAPTFAVTGLGNLNSIESGGELLLSGDVAVAQNASVNAVGDVAVTGTIDADASATNSTLTVRSGDRATFSGDVGAADPLTGFTVNAREVRFDEAGDQRVVTEAGGITLDGAGTPTAPPNTASVGKTGGDLSLETTGALAIGDGDKLSVEGDLELEGATVRVTDLSALDITVTSDDTRIFARDPGPVRLPDGTLAGDVGTDIIANTVSFSSAPATTGSGNAPRIATESGTATNAGGLGVIALAAPVTPDQLVADGRVLDLAILVSDPGHETPELEGGPIEPPFEPLLSRDEAGPGASVSSEEVVAFLGCAPLGEEFAPDGCAATAPPAYGSALDTERASDVARAYRELLSDSARSRAGRESLANAALDAKAELGAAATPAGRVYLTEVARLLGEVRLLGLGATYPEVRSELLESIARAISPDLAPERLAAAVDARAMGMQI
jgi:filamentous hemagglutinin family protein